MNPAESPSGKKKDSSGTVVLLSQVYVPDPASVGQHMADAAAELAARGHRVVVLTADRGYDDPSRRYPSRETIDGVEVRRLPFSSLGKRSFLMRILGGVAFVFQAIIAALFIRRVSVIIVSTSPPFAPIAAIVLSWIKRADVKFWVMDLNPDQLVVLRIVTKESWVARSFEWLNRRILGLASDVVVLDRFMADRVTSKLPVRHKLHVLPPWPHEDDLEPVPHADNPFRRQHGLQERFVVMYSGNHGPSNPIGTILAAAEQMVEDEDLVFVFVGGGVAKQEVEACRSPNVVSLPYQPLSQLKYSLSAADVHVVTLGNELVGVVHPCKIYGAMAVARPVFLVGPRDCSVGDILGQYDIGWQAPQGDVAEVVRVIRELRESSPEKRMAMGERGRQAIRERLSKAFLCGRLCDVFEGVREAADDRVEVGGWVGSAEAG